MSTQGINILVYNGPGVSESYRTALVNRLKKDIGLRYAVRTVDDKVLLAEPWETQCSLLVIPGGRDKQYADALSGGANTRIRNWVHHGGKYLGICAGAYYAADNVIFDETGPLRVVEKRELAFYNGDAVGPVWPGFEYETRRGERTVTLDISCDILQSFVENTQSSAIYNGGCYFVHDPLSVPLAVYSETSEKHVAGVMKNVGEGRAVLWGPHIELSAMPLLKGSIFVLGLDTPDQSSQSLTPLYIFPATDFPFEENEQISGKDHFRVTREIHPVIETGGHIAWPLITAEPTSESFNWGESMKHMANLTHAPFGHTFIYGDVVTSTQTLLVENMALTKRLRSGTLFLCNKQIQGRGRGGNAWVSPQGCLMFSGIVRLGLAEIATKGVLIQHLIGLAVVRALQSIEPRLCVKIKWPNDVFADLGPAHTGTDRLKKIFGVLVNAHTESPQTVAFVFGCGTNVANAAPTTSVNSILKDMGLEPTTLERVFAHVVKELNDMWPEFAANGFSGTLRHEYLARWMHTGEIVTLVESGQRLRVRDITASGYLCAEDVSTGEQVSLMPDGNSFDIFHGLIRAK